jgi:putative hydrolase of the HAD superfamily
VLITKGDLFHQESKVAGSGLGDLFSGVEIVAEKDPAAYQRVLARYGVPAESFAMVGNSLRSDVAPVLDLGGWGIHVPHDLTWVLEVPDDEDVVRAHARFRTCATVAVVPVLLDEINRPTADDRR